MHIKMLDNGIDSIKNGFKNYLKYQEDPKKDYYILKQAILSTHHGVEILLKCILYKQSEFLIIDNLRIEYKKAYKEKMDLGLENVFQTSYASKIHTITYMEALERVKYFTDILLNEKLERKLIELNKIRNALTHAEVAIEDSKIDETFENLLVDLDILFLRAFGTEYKEIYGYSDIKVNYDKYMNFLISNKMDVKKDVVDALLKALEKAQIFEGQEDIIYINDINKAKIFLKAFQKNQIFGMDLFNGWCSGFAHLSITDEEHISILAKDINNKIIIKFKSMIIYIPKIESNDSPVVILESDYDNVEPENECFVKDQCGVKCLEGLCLENSTRTYIYDQERIEDFLCQCEYNENFKIPNYWSITRFLSQKLIGCFNIQGLAYGNFRTLLDYSQKMTGEILAKHLKKN